MLEEVREQAEGVYFLRQVVQRKLTTPLLLLGESGVGRRFSVLQAIKEVFCTGTRAVGCLCIDCTQVTEGTHADCTVLSPAEGRDKRDLTLP